MMDGCQQIILGLILGTVEPTTATTFRSAHQTSFEYVLYLGLIAGIGNQISIPSRFIDHEISPDLRAPFSDPRGR